MAGKGPRRKSASFGGGWTDIKLAVLAKYLHAYTTALKNQAFQKWYIDAFAGTGSRLPPREPESGQGSLLPPPPGGDARELVDGSTRLALQTEPRFDRYLFIERSRASCRELDALKAAYPSRAADIHVVEGDANTVIRELCSHDWSMRRAVLFLDPFGMQVEWRTIEAIAKTEAIDLWYLFPFAMGTIRLLDPRGNIRPEWRPALDRTLPSGWFEGLYKTVSEPTLFDLDPGRARVTPEAVGNYLVERLRAVFAGVAPKPAVLKNSRGSPLYLFCFAASNKSGARVAVKIANDLLKGLA